jgi:hypothetical protein
MITYIDLMLKDLKISCPIKYTNAYYYVCGIALYKHKRTVYMMMQLYFKIII